eukprot:3687088-Prymnesium_polylepis.1
MQVLTGKGTHRGFYMWLGNAREELRLKRFAATIGDPPRRAAFNTWESFCESTERNRQLLRDGTARLFNQQLHRALRRWATFVEERRALRSVAASLTLPGSRTAFNTWRSNTKEVAHSSQLLRRSTAALFDKNAAMAFRRWKGSTLRGKQLSQIRAALAALQAAQLRRAVNSWADNVDRLARAYALLSGAAKKLHHRQALAAINSWCETLRMRQHNLEVMGHAAGIFSNQVLARALNTWRSGREQFRRMQGIFAGLVDQEVRRAMSTWVAAAEQ